MVADPADPNFGQFFSSNPMFLKDTDKTFQASIYECPLMESVYSVRAVKL